MALSNEEYATLVFGKQARRLQEASGMKYAKALRIVKKRNDLDYHGDETLNFINGVYSLI